MFQLLVVEVVVDGFVIGTDRDRVLEAAVGLLFPFQSREKRRQAEVVVPRPTFKRVVVAFGALQPDAEDSLAELGRHSFRTLHQAHEEIGRRRVDERAASHEKFSNKAIVRLVLGQGTAEPLEQLIAALESSPPAHLEQVGHDRGPELRVFGPVEKVIDELPAFVGIAGSKETIRLLGRRQHADGVEVNATNEDLVIGQVRGDDTQLPQLVEHEFVDQVVARNSRVIRGGGLGNDGNARHCRQTGHPDHDGGLTARAGRDFT